MFIHVRHILLYFQEVYFQTLYIVQYLMLDKPPADINVTEENQICFFVLRLINTRNKTWIDFLNGK